MSSRASSGLRFRLAGFDVSVPLNTLLGVGLIAWLWLPSFEAESRAQQWASALVFAFVLLASVLGHELAHAAAARRFGFPVVGITLWAFGGYTSYRPVRNTPGREALIAVSGPAATLVLAAVAWGMWQQMGDNSSMASEVLAAVAVANLLVGIFNLLPGLPLDGGGVLSAAVWAVTGSRVRGQRVAAYSGMVLAALLVGAPLLLASASGSSVDLSLVFVGAIMAAFLFVGARGALASADARASLEGRSAMDLAVPAVVVPAHVTLGDLDDFLSRGQRPGVVALVGDPVEGLQGYVLPPAAAAVPGHARSATPILTVTRSVPRWGWVRATATASEAVEMLAELACPVVVMDEANQPVGVIVARPTA